ELGTAEPLAETRGQDDGAAGPDDRHRPREALHRLVPGRVEWVAAAAGHDHLARRRHRRLDDALDETHALLPGADHVAGADPTDAAFAVDADVDDEVTAGHLRDARVLLVDGVAVEDAAVGAGVFEEARAVPDLDRLQRRDAGADDLAAAAVAGHQVRLDQPG